MFAVEGGNVSFCHIHKNRRITGITDELHAHLQQLAAGFGRVGEAAYLHALRGSLLNDLRDPIHNQRMGDLPDDAQRGGQIVRPYEHDVHAFDTENVIQIVDGLLTLGLKDHHGVLRLCEVVRAGNAAIGGGTNKAAGATGAAGREFRGGHSGARLIGTNSDLTGPSA